METDGTRRRYRDDWPLHILQRSRVVADRQGKPSCEACGHRPHDRDRYCGSCGRTLEWPRRAN